MDLLKIFYFLFSFQEEITKSQFLLKGSATSRKKVGCSIKRTSSCIFLLILSTVILFIEPVINCKHVILVTCYGIDVSLTSCEYTMHFLI